MNTSVSIIVPIFNASDCIPLLLERLEKSLNTLGVPFQAIFIDDGSRDNSWLLIKQFTEEYPWLAGIKLAVNAGQHCATLTGLKYAQHPIVVTMDDDLQHPPESLPMLLSELTPEIDLIYAAPDKLYRTASQEFLVSAMKLAIGLFSGKLFLRHVRSFRVMRTNIVAWKDITITRSSTVEALLAHTNPHIKTCFVPYAARYAGQSSGTTLRALKLALSIWKGALFKPSARGRDVTRVSEFAGWLASAS